MVDSQLQSFYSHLLPFFLSYTLTIIFFFFRNKMTASQACPSCVRLEVQNAQLKADFDKLKVNFSHFSPIFIYYNR